ncbi:LysR family transcriptional regulator [Ornithinibacillus bavariensis]|uniref:HTH-type transcriptional regulator YwbI n=1 Tax=Ornithinibacillus bavariensis TaxID=545502 RepID=A0A919XD12_9BACI|nr:LysR family transcriptional regulator [Ornithinibacillus bavariensis]GIO28385.1 putative HTH-type transcriptional regulator YwbI [Ornithinibacillus bavariensis]
MELRQLTYFMEVAKYKSITKAAEQLHISQPALSKSIKALEEELGTTLLIRTNKTSHITDAGNVVLEYARKMTGLVGEMKLTLSDLTNLLVGQLNIGLPPFIGSLFFPKVMAQFHHAYPNIKLDITEYGGARVVKSVEEEEFELGVAVLPVDEAIFNVYPIVEEEMLLLVPKNHPLANRKEVYIKDLKDEEFIFYHEEFALNKIIRNHFYITAGFEPKILFKSSQWDLMSEMVAANLGLSILPRSICNRLFAKDINIVSLKPTIMWRLAVITKKGRYISHAGRTFIDFIVKDKL